MKNSITLNLQPDSDGIQMAGQKSSNFLKSHGLSDETIHTQIMILKELIKNGIKYGKFTPSKNEISVSIHIAENTISVEVMNPVDVTCCERLDELDKTIQFLRGYQNPFQAYMLMKKKAPKYPFRGDADGLDLIKIAYEGKAILDFCVHENNMLNQSAVRRLGDKSGC